MDDLETAIRRIAAAGLPGAPPLADVADTVHTRWEEVLVVVNRERLWGLLADALGSGDLAGAPDAPSKAWELLHSALERTVRLETLLEETVGLLDAANVPSRVLMGPSLAHLDYPRPDLRSYTDMDLLVPSDGFDRAVASLSRAGHGRQGLPQRRPGYDRRFGVKVTFSTHRGMTIDLHRTLAFGQFPLRLPMASLWAGSEAFCIGRRTYYGLPLTQRFLSVCIHAALEGVPPRLVPLRDVAQMALTSGLDVGAVRDMAAEWGIQPVLVRAAVLAENVLCVRLGALGEWARHEPREGWEDRPLRPHREDHDLGVERSSETWKRIPGFGGKVRYLHAQLFPARTYLAGRYDNYPSYWLHQLRSRSSIR